MSLIVNADFVDGSACDGAELSITELIDSVRSCQDEVASWPVDSIIEIFDGLSSALVGERRDLNGRHPGAGIPFIANWLRRANLEAIVDSAIGARKYLNSFTASPSLPGRDLRAFPRGLAVHWMAGNVPTLGFLSLVQGMLTKNVNIIKLASGSGGLVADLLDTLSGIQSADGRNTGDLLKSVAVIRYDHSQKEIGSALSKAADVRALWGSDEGVEAIRALPSGMDSATVVFGAKTSMMIVDRETLANGDLDVITRRMAMDISVFEQKACASPHTIFLETADETELEKFALKLHTAMQGALKNAPRSRPAQHELSAILNLRAQYDMFHKSWASEGAEFTILSDDKFQLGPPVGGRTVYLRMTPDLDKVADLINPKVQTIGVAASDRRFGELSELYASKGAQRFSRVGSMTQFETPWDGYFLIQSLVRWATRPAIDLDGA